MVRSRMVKSVERGRVPDDVQLEVELLLSPSPTAVRQALLRKLAERYYELEPAIRTRFVREYLFRTPRELLDKVGMFARRNGLILGGTGKDEERADLPSRVTLRGSVKQMNDAFNFQLHWFSAGPSTHMAPANASKASLPPGLAEYVVGIVGFDRRPIISPLKWPVELPDDEEDTKRLLVSAPPAAPGYITVPELAKLYNFPPGLDGSGQKIGIILSYGGLHQSALDTYLQCLQLGARTVQVVKLQGAKNNPCSLDKLHGFLINSGLGTNAPPLPCGALGTGPVPRPASSGQVKPDVQLAFTLEAMLDTELIASVANGAEPRLYLTPPDIRGIKGAIEQAVTDGVDVLVLPWGFAEGTPGSNYVEIIDWALSHAVLDQGMTILCASGDYGSTPSRFKPNKVEAVFPASSLWAVACGGTALQASSSGTFSESVWNEQEVPIFGHLATGGGYSGIFDRPAWQTGNSEQKRGVPDFSISAAFATRLWVWFGMANGTALGTSASASILGGLVALLNQGLGRRVGLLTPLLYDSRVRAAMRGISRQGTNSILPSMVTFQADPQLSWNPCTGLGSPDGMRLFSALQARFSARELVAGLEAAEKLLLGAA